MSTQLQQTAVFGELAEMDQFFAPADTDMVDSLIGQYQATRRKVEALAEAVSADEISGVLHYFIEGNVSDHRYTMPSTVGALFRVEGAIAHLNADFWDRALRLTDVLDCMPQKRRDEWFEQIRCPEGRKANRHTGEQDLPPLPEFEEQTVRSTLGSLMAARSKFFAERVAGIFRALSRKHVTNRPEGFSKRMIVNRALSEWGGIDSSTAGYINDLRCIISQFMGRDGPEWHASNSVVEAEKRNPGQWMRVDGGTLRIRVYAGVGTAHLEVHPDMAWRLNAVLASLYPAAIPASFREKPKRQRKIKDFELFDRPLPFPVVGLLAGLNRGRQSMPNTVTFGGTSQDRQALKQAEDVLRAIGGVLVREDKEARICEHWAFDYDPQPVLDEIVCSGQIPDHQSHQFYPPPESIAARAVDLARIDETHDCLEPSAGIGNLADRMSPCASITCIEISRLHCEVLRQKGFHAEQADFMRWSADRQFDRIVMNPPFSEGRWAAHIEHASTMLAPDGRLVAILPASAKGKPVLDVARFTITWSEVFKNQFPGASVDVVIMVAEVRE